MESICVFISIFPLAQSGLLNKLASNPVIWVILIVALITLLSLTFYQYLRLKNTTNEVKEFTRKLTYLKEREVQLNDEIRLNEDLGIQNTELHELGLLQKKELESTRNELEKTKNLVNEQVLVKTGELQTQLEKAKESNKLKDALLEKISREIRTPLNSILGFINLLDDSSVAKIDREYYLKFIRESGNNLLSLIDNIVDFSKLEAGELLIEYKKCDLNLLLTDLIDRYRNRYLREKPNLAIVYNKPEFPIESLADCKRILHILEQLINNALKYTNEGKVEINYVVTKEYHVFNVIDTGIGIEEKYHDIIFESFYQIETKIKDIFHGAGLGLALAKKLTDMLGGSLSLESTIGVGSTFTLKIPYNEIKPSDHTILSNLQSFDWHNKTILIAEDEDSNYHLLDAVLKKTKANVIRADDGVKFLEIMSENKNVDLVLLDIKMPGINGFNAIKLIRQQNINIPVIAQTAFNQPEDKQRCLDSGCDDYLAKPIDKDLLLSKIAYYFTKP